MRALRRMVSSCVDKFVLVQQPIFPNRRLLNKRYASQPGAPQRPGLRQQGALLLMRLMLLGIVGSMFLFLLVGCQSKRELALQEDLSPIEAPSPLPPLELSDSTDEVGSGGTISAETGQTDPLSGADASGNHGEEGGKSVSAPASSATDATSGSQTRSSKALTEPLSHGASPKTSTPSTAMKSSAKPAATSAESWQQRLIAKPELEQPAATTGQSSAAAHSSSAGASASDQKKTQVSTNGTTKASGSGASSAGKPKTGLAAPPPPPQPPQPPAAPEPPKPLHSRVTVPQ